MTLLFPKQSHVLYLLDAGKWTGNLVALPNNRVRATSPACGKLRRCARLYAVSVDALSRKPRKLPDLVQLLITYIMTTKRRKKETLKLNRKNQKVVADVYTDGFKDTVSIKFATPSDARATVARLKIHKPYARKYNFNCCRATCKSYG